MFELGERLNAMRKTFAVTSLSLLVGLSGCVTTRIADIDQGAANHMATLKVSMFTSYQALLSQKFDERANFAAQDIDFNRHCDDITAGLRVQQLMEETRPRNEETIGMIKVVITSWDRYVGRHRKPDRPDVLVDFTLKTELKELSEQMRAYEAGEQAKQSVAKP